MQSKNFTRWQRELIYTTIGRDVAYCAVVQLGHTALEQLRGFLVYIKDVCILDCAVVKLLYKVVVVYLTLSTFLLLTTPTQSFKL